MKQIAEGAMVRLIRDGFVLVVLCSLLVACGGGGGGGGVGLGNTIDSSGGVIENSGIRIQIPNNTLQNSATINIQEQDKPPVIVSSFENQISNTYSINVSSNFYTINNDPVNIKIKFDKNKSYTSLINDHNTLVNVQFCPNSGGNFTFPVFGTISDNSITIIMRGLPNVPTYFTAVQINENNLGTLNLSTRAVTWSSSSWDLWTGVFGSFANYHFPSALTEATKEDLVPDGNITLQQMADKLNYNTVEAMKLGEVKINAEAISMYSANVNMKEPSNKNIILVERSYGGITYGLPWSNYLYSIYMSASDLDDNINNNDIKGGFKSVLAHEIFHKIFAEYGFVNEDFQAINESMAALFGATAGNTNNELKIMKLHSLYPISMPLFLKYSAWYIPLLEVNPDSHYNYHYQGFLYYLAKKYLNNNLIFINDFLNDYKNSINFIENIWGTASEKQKIAYESLDRIINNNKSTDNLQNSFWDYIKNYGFEHNNIESNPYSIEPIGMFKCNQEAFSKDTLQMPVIYQDNIDTEKNLTIRRMSGNYINIFPSTGVKAIRMSIKNPQNADLQNIKVKIYYIKSNGDVHERNFEKEKELSGNQIITDLYEPGYLESYNNIYMIFANLDFKNDISQLKVSIMFDRDASSTGLSISPPEGLSSSGSQGGYFSPVSTTYRLSNTGNAPIPWTATKTHPWVLLSSQYGAIVQMGSVGGTIEAGKYADVTVTINSDANSLLAGNYSDKVTFYAAGNIVAERPVTLQVLSSVPPGTISPPTFSPTPGTYTTPQSVILSTTTPGATIRYTTDGSMPSSTVGTVYTGPILISTTTMIRAVAYIVGGAISSVSSVAYTIPPPTVGTLLVTPAGDLSSLGQKSGPFFPASITYSLTNTNTDGTSINWTASKTQSWVTLSSTGGPLAAGGTSSVTVSINSEANSLDFGNYSDTVTFTNTTNNSGTTSRFVGLTVAPVCPVGGPVTFSPPPGTYTTPQSVELSAYSGPPCTATINYSTDGINGKVYTAPIYISTTTTIRADSYLSGEGYIAGPVSETTIGVYTITGAEGVTGTWVGTYTTSLIPSAEITLILTQSGTNVTGTYSTATGVGGAAGGTYTGTASGDVINWTINQTTPECPGSFSGTSTVTGNTMNFTFTGTDCAGFHNNGQGTATRQ